MILTLNFRNARLSHVLFSKLLCVTPPPPTRFRFSVAFLKLLFSSPSVLFVCSQCLLHCPLFVVGNISPGSGDDHIWAWMVQGVSGWFTQVGGYSSGGAKTLVCVCARAGAWHHSFLSVELMLYNNPVFVCPPRFFCYVKYTFSISSFFPTLDTPFWAISYIHHSVNMTTETANASSIMS